MQSSHLKRVVYGLGCFALFACSGKITVDKNINEFPSIFPDYKEVTIPANIAPLHFKLTDSCDCTEAYAYFEVDSKSVKVKASKKQMAIRPSDWEKITEAAKGKAVEVKVVIKKGQEWIAYKPFHLFVSQDPIDPYIAYRLIEPGYETWNEMGIYQRCIETYKQTPVVTNKMTGNNCMNCHSFCMQSPDKMLFHMRKDYSGTYLIDGDNIEKLNTKTPKTISPLVYPSWHPSGNFVAFSVNSTKQMFHTTDRNRTEVFDYKSDVVVYDVKKHEIFTSPLLFSKSAFETFPTFSPDGYTD